METAEKIEANSTNPSGLLQSNELYKVLSHQCCYLLEIFSYRSRNDVCVFLTGLIRSWQYILETNVYPREAEILKELRTATANHRL